MQHTDDDLLLDPIRRFLDEQCPLAVLRGAARLHGQASGDVGSSGGKRNSHFRQHAAGRHAESGRTVYPRLWERICELGWPMLLVSEDREGIGMGMAQATRVMELAGRALLPLPLGYWINSIAFLNELDAESPITISMQECLQEGRLAGFVLEDKVSRNFVPYCLHEAPFLKLSFSDGKVKVQLTRVSGRDGGDIGGAEGTTGGVKGGIKGGAAAGGRAGDNSVAAQDMEKIASGAGPQATRGATGIDPLIDSAWLGDPEWQMQDTLHCDLAAWEAYGHRFRLLLAAELLGVAGRALELATAYAQERQQFGRPIGSFQAIKHRLAQDWMNLDNARLLIAEAAQAMDARLADNTGEPGDSSVAEVAMSARSFAVRDEQACTETEGTTQAVQSALAVTLAEHVTQRAADSAVRNALQVHGAMGMTWECDAHFYLKRVHFLNAMLNLERRDADRLQEIWQFSEARMATY